MQYFYIQPIVPWYYVTAAYIAEAHTNVHLFT